MHDLSDALLNALTSCTVSGIVQQTTPQDIGERSVMLFEFARRLKGLPSYRELDPEDCEEAFDEWHEAAEPAIRTKHRNFNWNEFCKAFVGVKYPTPPWSQNVAQLEVHERAIQYLFSQNGASAGKTIVCDERVVALCLDIEIPEVHKACRKLLEYRWIERVGSPSTGKPSRYRITKRLRVFLLT